MEAIYIDLRSFEHIEFPLKKYPFIRIKAGCGLESQHLLNFHNHLASKGIHVSSFLGTNGERIVDVYFEEYR